MAHYAILDQDNIVTHVFVGKDESDQEDWEHYYSVLYSARCLRTSYNTYLGRHRTKDRIPFRGNYAGTGYRYDDVLDAFIRPRPFPSWTLSTNTYDWVPPKPYPNDNKYYEWDEEVKDWIAS